MKTQTQKGFTIIELMIATLIFSTVLGLLTAGVLYFTKMYYKGINLSNTQNTARLITDSISQAIQFSGTGQLQLPVAQSGANSDVQVMCIGSKRYTFTLGKQVRLDGAPGSVRHGLVVDTPNSSCANSVMVEGFKAPLLTNQEGKNTTAELIDDRMRLTGLSIEDASGGTSTLYRVTVGVAYGDNDLFTSTSGPNAFKQCSSTAGSQFCATSTLTTIVQKRVN